MKKGVKVIAAILAVGVVAGAVIVPRAMKKEEAIVPIPDPNVSVEQAVTADIILENGIIGKVEASDLVYILPKSAGDIAEVFVREGDRVEKGQQLCRIDNSKQIEANKIQMDAALVSLENARTTLSRMQVLYQAGDISAQNYEQVQMQAKSAQLQYDSAKLQYETQLEYSVVTAPISGVLESLSMETHMTVSQSSQLGLITGEGGKKIAFSVSERIRDHLQAGDVIQAEKLGTRYPVTITKISNMISAQTGLFTVEGLVENGDALPVGSSLKLYVISEKAEDALTLPVDSVYYDGGHSYVYTCADNVVHKVMVETGIFDDLRIEIKSGISPQDYIVTTWSSELYEGARVVVVQENGQEKE